MNKEIKFTGYDGTKCDIECTDGEIALALGTSANTDSALSGSIKIDRRIHLPQGHKAILIHNTSDGDKKLITVTTDTEAPRLYWCHYDPETTEISTDALHHIGQTAEATCHTANGDTIIIGTTAGTVYLYWHGNGYRMIKPRDRMPAIDFGLQKAGELFGNDTIVTETPLANQLGQNGSGASRPHVIGTDEKAKIDNIGKTISDCYQQALTSQVISKGYFHQPFMLRYALRLHDGTYAACSSPILMLPTTLPPIISLNMRAGTDDKVHIDIDLTSNNYFELRYRIADAGDSGWADIATAIDIFISKPIETHSADKIQDGYITTYRALTSAVNGGTFGRTPRPSRDGEGQDILAGHYSEANDNYADHPASTDNRQIWYISPNAHLQDQIIAPHDMYLIASLPIEQVQAETTFQTINPITTDPKEMGGCKRLDVSGISLQAHYAHLLPSACTTYTDKTLIAGNSEMPTAPLPLCMMTPYSGNAESEALSTEITTYKKHKGQTYKSISVTLERRAALGTDMPRYLYHPDPETFMITLRQGDRLWTMPTNPDPSGHGAYWWGGLAADPTPESTEIPEALSTPPSGDAMVYITDTRAPMCATSALPLGCATVHAFAVAMQAPQSGQFGQYPLYAFTDQGILMLQYSDAAGALTGARLISHDRCSNSAAITAVGDKVAYATSNAVKIISGTKITDITYRMPIKATGIAELPHLHELLTVIGMPTIHMPTTGALTFNDAVLTYYSNIDTMILSSGDYSVLVPGRDSGTGLCSYIDLSISHKVKDGYQEVAVDDNGSIFTIEEGAEMSTSMLVTRPIKVTGSTAGKIVREVEVTGRFRHGHISTALYGADRIGEWHLMGTSTDERVYNDNQRRYRFFIAAIIANLDAGEYLHGLSLSYESN